MLMVCAVIYTRAAPVLGKKQSRRCRQDPDPTHTDPQHTDPQHPSMRSRAGLGLVTWVSQESRIPGQLTATRQGQGQAGKSSQHSKARLNVVQDGALPFLLCSSGRDRGLSLKLSLSLGLKAGTKLRDGQNHSLWLSSFSAIFS